jgi:hypothetical protein
MTVCLHAKFLFPIAYASLQYLKLLRNYLSSGEKKNNLPTRKENAFYIMEAYLNKKRLCYFPGIKNTSSTHLFLTIIL